MKLIALVGSAGSGKNAVADFLIKHYGFQSLSFAGALKDAVAAIFGWDRVLLEGDTKESREWRETVDEWWAKELDMPGLTPRIVLQKFGTEVVRTGFSKAIWLTALKRHISQLPEDAKVVITDARFPNELDMTTEMGGHIAYVKRGPTPVWWDAQLRIAADKYGFTDEGEALFNADYAAIKDVHESERAWARNEQDYGYILRNDGTMGDLEEWTHELMAYVDLAEQVENAWTFATHEQLADAVRRFQA